MNSDIFTSNIQTYETYLITLNFSVKFPPLIL